MEPVVHNNQNNEILISDGQSIVDIFSRDCWTKTIKVDSWATASYTAIVYDDVSITLECETSWEKSDLTIAVLCLAKDPHRVFVDLRAGLLHSHCSYNIHMVTLYATWWNAHINWNIIMHPWIFKVEGHLLEENIIIGEGVQIKTLPMLDVRSNDVVASHGARIEKVDPEKLFYLTSKWLSTQDATALMVWWYITTMLEWIQKEWLIAKRKAFCLAYILNE